MNRQVTVVFLLTFIINLIGTLAYALRIAGVRTRRIAVSLAVFNILLLVSRTANTFQGPLLAKHIERNILGGPFSNVEHDLRWLILAASLATFAGVFLIPTFQRLFSKTIASLDTYRSLPRLAVRIFYRSSWRQVRDSASFPSRENLAMLRFAEAPRVILIFNMLATAFLTVGVFSSLYAGYLKPELRVTANNLSPIINAFSTILLFVFIDPYLSFLTDDVVNGKATEARFRSCVFWLASSRLAGTLLAQLLLVPAAILIVKVAELL
jgi:hypothetical protein